MRSSVKSFIHQTGGLSYHYLAWKYRKTLWRRFYEQLNWCLYDWRHFCSEIILVGPSGGYNLSSEFLSGFKKIHVYDPDPMARFFFQKRFPQLPIYWHLESPFFNSHSNSTQALWKCKNQYPEAAILFCNVIGQWPLLEPVNEEKMKEFANQLNQVYGQGQWASFHDLFSGPCSWKKWSPDLKRKQFQFKNIDEIKKLWGQVNGNHLTDHLTIHLFNECPSKKHLIWPLSPQQIHIIEWVHG